MIDVMTRKPLQVSSEGTSGPYVRLPMSQLAEVCRLLDENGIRYWVDEFAISLDGEPETTIINLGRGAEAGPVSVILDSVQ